jgi:hypothetical protein
MRLPFPTRMYEKTLLTNTKGFSDLEFFYLCKTDMLTTRWRAYLGCVAPKKIRENLSNLSHLWSKKNIAFSIFLCQYQNINYEGRYPPSV